MRKKTRRELRSVGGSLDGVTLTVRRAIRAGRNTLPVGTDVTDEAKSWPRLRTLLKRGYITASPDVDPRKVVPQPAPPPTAKVEEEPDGTGEESDGPNRLEALSAASTKHEIRDALLAAGLKAPAAFSKGELLAIRDDFLGG